MEVETYILLARELGHLEHDSSDNLLSSSAEVGRILNGLLNLLGKREKPILKHAGTLITDHCPLSTVHC
jgi:hypothetical protein